MKKKSVKDKISQMTYDKRPLQKKIIVVQNSIYEIGKLLGCEFKKK